MCAGQFQQLRAAVHHMLRPGDELTRIPVTNIISVPAMRLDT